MHSSTKTYGHNEGLSCCFRQPKAIHSHCSLLHGYALSFRFIFSAETLDDKNWVVDFGGMKDLKVWLHHMFDHTWAVDSADPKLDEIVEFVAATNIADLRVMDGVGCEMFAKYAFDFADAFVRKECPDRVRCTSVEVMEHSGNSAIYTL